MTEALDIAKCVKNLRDVFLFQDLSDKRLEQVGRLCELLWLERGDNIMHEDSEAGGLYILLRGEVAISKKIKLPHLEAVHGEDRILTRMGAEHYPVLGETALVGQHTRSATVSCSAPCALYRIEAEPFMELALRDPAIGCAVFRRLSQTLYERMETTSGDVVKLSAALVYALEEQRGAMG